MVKEGKLTDGYLRAINNGDRLLQEKKQYLQKRLFYIKSRDPFFFIKDGWTFREFS